MRRAPYVEPLLFNRTHNSWTRTLWIGVTIFAVGVAVLTVTENLKLFPAVMLIGSFLIPVVYVVFIFDHRRLSRMTLPTVAMSFFYGGVLGVFAAALLEPIFIRRLTFASAFEVGLIEEFAKIIGVLVVAQTMAHTSELDGLIIGAAAGMGFAALESMGYTFTAFLGSKGSMSATVTVTLIRGLMAPLGHGTWTAILSAVLFRDSGTRGFRLTGGVIGAYLLVSALHGMWDGVPSLIGEFELPGINLLLSESIVGLLGIYILWRVWREAVHRQVSRLRLHRIPRGLPGSQGR